MFEADSETCNRTWPQLADLQKSRVRLSLESACVVREFSQGLFSHGGAAFGNCMPASNEQELPCEM